MTRLSTKTFALALHIVVSTALPTLASAAPASSKLPIANGSRILFIGNSFTGTRCGLPRYLEDALKNGSPSLTVHTEMVIRWGQQLSAHLAENPSEALGKIREGTWDIVVVQGYSDAHHAHPDTVERFFNAVRALDRVIDSVGAQTVLYMPWAYNPLASWYSKERYKTDTEKLVQNYTKIAKEINAPVVPIGQLWYGLTINPPRTGLAYNYLWYVKDGKTDIHQTVASSCLNAWAFYAFLTRRSPVGVAINTSFCNEGAAPDAALALAFQERAWSIISQPDEETGTRVPAPPQSTRAPSTQSTGHTSLDGKSIPASATPATQLLLKKHADGKGQGVLPLH